MKTKTGPVRFILCWLCSAAMLIQGCASWVPFNRKAVFRTVDQELTIAEQAHLGHVEVLAVNTEPRLSVSGYQTKPFGTLTGAVVGGASGYYVGAIVDFFGGPYYGIIMAVGVVGGGVIGYAVSDSDESIQSLREDLERAIEQINPSTRLSAVVAQNIGNSTFHTLTNPDLINTPQSAYVMPVKNGADSVLEITVQSVGLSPYIGSYWDGTVVHVVVQVRLCRAGDGAVISDTRYTYRSTAGNQLSFWKWADQNATPFRLEVLHALDTLAEAIAQDLATQTKRSRPPYTGSY